MNRIRIFFALLLVALLAAPVVSARSRNKIARCKRTCTRLRNQMAKECTKLPKASDSASCRKNFLPKIEKDCMASCQKRNKKKKRRRRR